MKRTWQESSSALLREAVSLATDTGPGMSNDPSTAPNDLSHLGKFVLSFTLSWHTSTHVQSKRHQIP